MGIARSTCYQASKGSADDTALVEAMHAIKDGFEAYGWRRMQAALRHRGWVVNHKKIKRLMREHALHPPRRRRFVATTVSDHDEPVFPDRSRDRETDGPNQLWVADLTYIAILGGFVYLAAIMDAWSRRIVGYALGRRIDVRLTLAALTAAIEGRHPPPGCVHHSDRGSQYAAQAYRALLDDHSLAGSMGRRGNPYDNAMMESFMKTLKVEGVYPMAFKSAEDVAEHLPRFIDSYNERRLHSALGYGQPCDSFHGAQLEGQPDWRRPGEDGIFPAPPHDATGHTWHHDNRLLFDYTKLGGKALMEARGVAGIKSGMPGLGDVMSDDGIWDVLAYIRSTWPERIRTIQAAGNPEHGR